MNKLNQIVKSCGKMLIIFGTVVVIVVTFLIMCVTSLIQYPFKFATRYLLNFLKNKRIEIQNDENVDENCVHILNVVDGDINSVTTLIKYFK
jgi:hypothetical protein